MFTINFDLSDLEKKIRGVAVAADSQVPFAISLSFNQALGNTRNLLIQEWPQHVNARNAHYLANALTRGEPSTKDNLYVELYDALPGRGHLKELDTGGTHSARRAMLAIPINARRGSHGVVTSDLPKNLVNSFRRGDVIYQRVGKRGLKLMWVLKASVPIPAAMPFTDDFATSMTNELRTNIPGAMMRAVLTSWK
jgi:hypothetical protein